VVKGFGVSTQLGDTVEGGDIVMLFLVGCLPCAFSVLLLLCKLVQQFSSEKNKTLLLVGLDTTEVD
jgi:hypothetical protein